MDITASGLLDLHIPPIQATRLRLLFEKAKHWLAFLSHTSMWDGAVVTLHPVQIYSTPKGTL
jgi:hypothetical protein